jgi:hypothetical protein
MSDTIIVSAAVPEGGVVMDGKVGYTVKFRVLRSSSETDARLLALMRGKVPCKLVLSPADEILDVNPLIDYSDVDAIFDPDIDEDDDAEM